ncbi:hypothetical protein D3C85_1320720 [compost metagenome]
MHIPPFLMELRPPGGRLPFHLKDLFGGKDEVVDRFKTRMTEFTPLPDALTQLVEISFE